jgi:hypothetical protein
LDREHLYRGVFVVRDHRDRRLGGEPVSGRRYWPRTLLGRYFFALAVAGFGLAVLVTVMEVQRGGWGSVLIGWSVLAAVVGVCVWIGRGESS